ncbi:MAG: SUMF1/EgtB/PvdO family nonheme iron enzyme [Bacteroidetes bacterium]|nr:SUMF1/EgtB/PvdO family nonheme iron enzyme [Bacteroidota bacterium]
MNRPILFYAAGLFMIICMGFALQKRTFHSGQKPETSLIPAGMVLVSGNEEIRPFLISALPVSNMDYFIYQQWLNKVFIDYPEVWLSSKIKTYKSNPVFNDPAETDYMGHPAYAAYPIRGASWMQAMEYCAWRTDRINEAVCIELGGLKWEEELKCTISENNFQTEAYINGQFEFCHKFNRYDSLLKGNRIRDNFSTVYDINPVRDFPFFHYGGRLPTEEEWLYFQQSKVNKPASFVGDFQRNIASYTGVSAAQTQWTEKQISKAREVSFSADFTEWMLEAEMQVKNYKRNYIRMFAENHMAPQNANLFLDAYGSLDQKDSLGHFPFRIMDVTPGGEALITFRYGSRYYKYRAVNLEPDREMADSIETWYRRSFICNPGVAMRTPNPGLNYAQRHMSIAGNRMWLSNWKTAFNLTTEMPPFVSVENDIAFLRNETTYQGLTTDTCLGCREELGIYRLRRGKSQRLQGLENIGYENTGFRFVLPWYGYALPRPIEW